jgi:hypothetical protein
MLARSAAIWNGRRRRFRKFSHFQQDLTNEHGQAGQQQDDAFYFFHFFIFYLQRSLVRDRIQAIVISLANGAII